MTAQRVSAQRASLSSYAWLSIAAALLTMAIKATAWWITGSVGLLSDALESSINLVAAIGALVALRVAALPADSSHPFGHAKAEYFSALAEGVMIVVAAVTIAWAAIGRFITPRPLEDLGVGLAITILASGINLAVALVLRRAGRAHRSITLEADGRHLMTDVWTSIGVVIGVALVGITGIERLDPVVALAVAANIVVTGVGLIRRSASGLMDAALPEEQQALVRRVLESHTSQDVQFHGLRTRAAGHRAFLTVHVLVPGAWSVQAAHDVAERVEADLRGVVEDLTVTTHVEPLEDPRSFADEDLDRRPLPPSARPHREPEDP